MKKIKVIKVEYYKKCYKKLDKSIQKQIDKQEKILIKSGGKGKPIYKNTLFERKAENYRIYYFKKDNDKIILVFISIHKKTSNKKQQEEINKIIKLILETNNFQL